MSEPHEILGVDPGAASDVVKRAYYRLVRKHPPDKDPTKFQVIRQAYLLLCDPRSGKTMHVRSSTGPDMVAVRRYIAARQFDLAENELRPHVTKAPAALEVQKEWGRVMAYLKRWSESIEALTPLASQGVDDRELWLALGLSHSRLTDGNLDLARLCLQRALNHAPGNQKVMRLIVETFDRQGRTLEASEWRARIDGIRQNSLRSKSRQQKRPDAGTQAEVTSGKGVVPPPPIQESRRVSTTESTSERVAVPAPHQENPEAATAHAVQGRMDFFVRDCPGAPDRRIELFVDGVVVGWGKVTVGLKVAVKLNPGTRTVALHCGAIKLSQTFVVSPGDHFKGSASFLPQQDRIFGLMVQKSLH